ncbi:MAG: transposase [Myxococcota bacterium]
MSKRRYFEKHAIYRVYNRTINGEALFTPSAEVSKIIENNLAWATDKHDIRLFGYLFQPDRFDMILMAPHLNIPQFMGDFQALTAREINAHHERNGRFFAGRYDDAKLGDDVQLENLIHVLETPAIRGFVEHPHQWEGASSLRLHRSGDALVGYREDSAKMRQLMRADPQLTREEARERATTRHVVQLAELPDYSPVSPEECRQRLDDLSNEVVSPNETSDERNVATDIEPDEPSGPSGMSRVRDWHFTHRLTDPQPRLPAYLTRNTPRRAAFFKKLDDKNLNYEWARKRLRNGMRRPRFPKGMIPLHRTHVVGSTRPPGQTASRAGPH